MGNTCCAPPVNITDGGDLPDIRSTSHDPVKQFEFNYPFYRMDSRQMFQRVHQKLGEMFTIKDLQRILTGKIWNNKLDEDGDVFDLLMELPNTVQDISEREQHKIYK